MSTVVLYSGGLDSFLVMQQPEAHDALPLFVDYGQEYATEERVACITQLHGRMRTVEVSGLPDLGGDVFVPARNLFLATIACRFNPDTILLGGVADDNVVDNTRHAHEEMSRILTAQCDRPVTVRSPFATRNKADVVADYLANGGTAEALQRTFSCFTPLPSRRRCNNCPACLRWSVALRVNFVDVAPPEVGITRDYLQRLHTYSPHRQWTLLAAINTPEHPVLHVDIDGVLTTADVDVSEYTVAAPNHDAIRALADAHERGAWIILHSARRALDRMVTLEWLSRYDVPFHALLLEKLPAQARYDDRTHQRLDSITLDPRTWAPMR